MAKTRGARAHRDVPGLREAKKRQVKRKLLASAVELFEEHGFEATRIRDITERAEVSHATFFNYFAGRDGLASEWIHEQLDQVFEESADAAQTGPLRPCVRHRSSGLKPASRAPLPERRAQPDARGGKPAARPPEQDTRQRALKEPSMPPTRVPNC